MDTYHGRPNTAKCQMRHAKIPANDIQDWNPCDLAEHIHDLDQENIKLKMWYSSAEKVKATFALCINELRDENKKLKAELAKLKSKIEFLVNGGNEDAWSDDE
jgi:ribosomal protein L29